MVLFPIGDIANEYWIKIPEHFPNVILHQHIIMPNHIHGIIELIHVNQTVDCSDNETPPVGTRHVVSNHADNQNHTDIQNCAGEQNHVNSQNHEGKQYFRTQQFRTRHFRTRHVVSLQSTNTFGKPISGSVSVIIQQYKSSVKRWCNKNGFHNIQWQPRFYDHIIRNFRSYQYISNYIINNPKQWDDDMFFN